jgi:hypothetical protein
VCPLCIIIKLEMILGSLQLWSTIVLL